MIYPLRPNKPSRDRQGAEHLDYAPSSHGDKGSAS